MSPATVLNLRDFPPTVHLYPDGKWRKGRVLPPDVVRIDRATRWGNPWKVGLNTDRVDVLRAVALLGLPPIPSGGGFVATGLYLSREQAIEAFRRAVAEHWPPEDWWAPLKGKRLACWCHPLPCHGDVIAEFLDDAR